MNCESVRELLEAHALGALDKDEARAVEEHLVGCRGCRELLLELQETAAGLVDALPNVPLAQAVELRQRVMGRVMAAPPSRNRVLVQWPRILRRLVPVRALAACLVVLLVGSLAVWGLQQRSALAKERSMRAELQALIGQQELVLEVVDSSRTIKSQLRAVEPGSTAYGKLYTRPDMPWAVVLVGRLPPKSDDETYNLWVTRDGNEQLAGQLEINENGFALILFDAGVNGPVYQAARVVRQVPGGDTSSGITVVRWEAAR